jgi:hypothetical protein
MEFVKRDLDEFSVAMSTQASNVVSSTATVLKDKLKVGHFFSPPSATSVTNHCIMCMIKLQLDDEESAAGSMKKSFSTLLVQVNDVLNPQPEDEDEEAMVIQGSEPVSLSTFQVAGLCLSVLIALNLIFRCQTIILMMMYGI